MDHNSIVVTGSEWWRSRHRSRTTSNSHRFAAERCEALVSMPRDTRRRGDGTQSKETRRAGRHRVHTVPLTTANGVLDLTLRLSKQDRLLGRHELVLRAAGRATAPSVGVCALSAAFRPFSAHTTDEQNLRSGLDHRHSRHVRSSCSATVQAAPNVTGPSRCRRTPRRAGRHLRHSPLACRPVV